jgi:hypothetical protein
MWFNPTARGFTGSVIGVLHSFYNRWEKALLEATLAL